MSWLVWIFVFVVTFGASQFARHKGHDDQTVSAILFAGLLASIGYFLTGRAELPDQPYAERVEELTEASRQGKSLSPAQQLAHLQALTQSQPDKPQPHFFIGEMLRNQGRDQDAIRAYQSALRRDDRFVPAMIALADALTRLSGGQVGADAKRIYARAIILDPSQVRAGFLAGYADWQAGNEAAARNRWKVVREALPADDQGRRQMLDALIGEAERERSGISE